MKSPSVLPETDGRAYASTDEEREPDSQAWLSGVRHGSCPTCSAIVVEGEGFCTSCGAPLDVASPGTIESRARVSPFRRMRSHSRRILMVAASSLLLLGLITALVLFAMAWHQQTAKRRAAEATLSATRSELAATQGRLRQSQVLLARQQAILKQTALVLRKVDPLLSGADQLQQLTTEIQGARDTFASDSAQMTTDLIYLENVMADPAGYAGVDSWSLVNQVNAELATVRSDSSALAGYDGDYSDASSAFGNTATSLTTAVRRLQRELKQLSPAKPSTGAR
jgi:transposase-like protein